MSATLPPDLPFHPSVAAWFAERLGQPTEPQRRGWPAIAAGGHVLIAAPTGTGKTLAAFLWALDGLLRQGPSLPDRTAVLYVSPLRALSNDVQKNLAAPLAELRATDPSLPELRVLVRTGDTPAKERAAMLAASRRPHVLVTTPESLYLLLTSEGGRRLLADLRTVIVDEIHALARDKRGSHLALSLERLDALTGGCQRIGLSATQKPLDAVANLLVGVGRRATLIDAGHRRPMDLGVELPADPLGAVCSHEQWACLHARMAELIREHRTTLVFVGTRKLAERLAARLTEALGAGQVACHHGSLSRELRQDAETRLKAGSLAALVATASLELGIDIGEVDLVIQVGSPRSIAAALQRVGRAGHGVDRLPKGRFFPLTRDELAEAAALLDCLRRGELDRTPEAPPALDILLQQVVAACVAEAWDEAALFATLSRAWPYRRLTRPEFDRAVALHCGGRGALLHRDGVQGRLLATRRARLPALTSGGAIPDAADYQVRLEPEGLLVGTLNEDFAIEANVQDIFQLGNTSWRILRVEPGVVRVADAQGQPPTLPFWVGEAPARTAELCAEIGVQREHPPARDALVDLGLSESAADQLLEYLAGMRADLGTVPTQQRLVAERFFDETGGMQLVLHAPFGGRLNRALGLALRKCFCRGFGFELQAAATEEAILLSLGPQHSFELASVFRFLHSRTAREVLIQALLAAPMFTTRWRWNVSRALLLPRTRGGQRVPPALQRMRADDLLAAAFPQVLACGETLPPGDIPVPMDHPIVAQTVEDCLTEAMDVEGLLALLAGIESGSIETVAVDRPEPSVAALSILAAQPYAFLDDAPLEERRTQAVARRRGLAPEVADSLGALDAAAVARVREQAWPDPASAEELHEALLWMGFLRADEVGSWGSWLAALAAAGRVEQDGGRWFAKEAPRDALSLWRGRLEALGPVFDDDPVLHELEAEGSALRTRIDGRRAFCNRRLLARIHAETLATLRAEIVPVSAADLLAFLLAFQHVESTRQLDGPAGVAAVVVQLAGFEAPLAEWERALLPARVRGYRPAWLDELALSGQLVCARLWSTGQGPLRGVPLALLPRDELEAWLALAAPGDPWSLKGSGRVVHEVLAARGACFPQDLPRLTGLLPAQVAEGLTQLVGLGLATADSLASLRALRPAARRRSAERGGPAALGMGRWSLVTRGGACRGGEAEFVARVCLRRYGVVFRRLLEREGFRLPWRPVLMALRKLEARGEIRGGRFVAGFSGEQYALPEALELLRRLRREGRPARAPVEVAAADPLNLQGIVTPDTKVPRNARQRVKVG